MELLKIYILVILVMWAVALSQTQSLLLSVIAIALIALFYPIYYGDIK